MRKTTLIAILAVIGLIALAIWRRSGGEQREFDRADYDTSDGG
jgi:HAMP domain-containing protein